MREYHAFGVKLTRSLFSGSVAVLRRIVIPLGLGNPVDRLTILLLRPISAHRTCALRREALMQTRSVERIVDPAVRRATFF